MSIQWTREEDWDAAGAQTAAAKIVYFSKMFQAVPHLANVAEKLPGVFVSNRRSTLQAVKSLYPQLPTASYSRFFGSLAKGNRKLKAADVIVTGSPYRSFLEGYEAKKCTVFHGTYMLLSRDALLHNAHFDLLCVIGPRMQGMIDRFADDIRVNTIRTGFLPFCEFPERSPAHRHEVLLRLGLDPAKRTVVYTPSRRGIGSWDAAAERLLETAPGHFNLILRPHPSQALTSRRNDRASFRRVREMALRRADSILDLTTYPLPLLLSIADLVVSDANSPAEESLFYDVPLLFIETPQYSKDTIFSQGRRESMHPEDIDRLATFYDCGLRCYVDSAPDFANLLDAAICRDAAFKAQREAYFSWVFGVRDRQANVRVASAIRQHLLN